MAVSGQDLHFLMRSTQLRRWRQPQQQMLGVQILPLPCQFLSCLPSAPTRIHQAGAAVAASIQKAVARTGTHASSAISIMTSGRVTGRRSVTVASQTMASKAPWRIKCAKVKCTEGCRPLEWDPAHAPAQTQKGIRVKSFRSQRRAVCAKPPAAFSLGFKVGPCTWAMESSILQLFGWLVCS